MVACFTSSTKRTITESRPTAVSVSAVSQSLGPCVSAGVGSPRHLQELRVSCTFTIHMTKVPLLLYTRGETLHLETTSVELEQRGFSHYFNNKCIAVHRWQRLLSTKPSIGVIKAGVGPGSPRCRLLEIQMSHLCNMLLVELSGSAFPLHVCMFEWAGLLRACFV